MTSLLKNDDHVTPAKATKSSFITQDQSEPISSNPKQTSFLMSDDQTTSTKVKKDDQTTSTKVGKDDQTTLAKVGKASFITADKPDPITSSNPPKIKNFLT